MKTILHVGTHKTGTTTIQHFAHRNTRQLRTRGIWYPSYDLIGLERRYAHHDFAHAVAETPNAALNLDQAKAFVKAIAERGNSLDTVLLSAEPIYRYVIGGGEVDQYWAGHDLYLKRLAEVMAPLDPEIVIVLRRQDDFARSLYQESVKSKNIRSEFRQFLAERIHYFEYLEQIKLFRKYFRSVDIVVFEDLVKQGNLLQAFFSHLGVGIDRMLPIPEMNESLPIDLVEFKWLLNGSSLNKQQFSTISNLLLGIGRHKKFPKRPNCDWVPAEEMQAFIAQFERANAEILMMMRQRPDRPTLFPPARPRTEVFGGLSMDKIIAINAQLLRQLIVRAQAEK